MHRPTWRKVPCKSCGQTTTTTSYRNDILCEACRKRKHQLSRKKSRRQPRVYSFEKQLNERLAKCAFVVLHDPYEWGFSKGAKFSCSEIRAMLSHACFTTGTRIRDNRTQIAHQVVLSTKGGQTLKPPLN